MHLFWFCPTTAKFTDKFFLDLMPEGSAWLDSARKKFWFTGTTDDNIKIPEILNTARIVTLYSIWEYHQKKKVPSWYTLKLDIIYELKKIGNIHPPNHIGFNIRNFHIFRNWDELTANRD